MKEGQMTGEDVSNVMKEFTGRMAQFAHHCMLTHDLPPSAVNIGTGFIYCEENEAQENMRAGWYILARIANHNDEALIGPYATELEAHLVMTLYATVGLKTGNIGPVPKTPKEDIH